ncbi:MAG: helix-turn-helix domain-containing protein [Puniceicoccaceae bacterium]|nr:MAG: helix-turn-helix domain-containing protein [Puniceicoccaceae bacterium]
MPTLAPVEPNSAVLLWARQESGYPLERVAKRLGVKPERIEAWEQGEARPTPHQLQNLARFYHRPLGLFFRTNPPTLPPLAAEYRRLPGVTPGAESPELRLALRQMSNRRETMIELLEELGESLPDFDLQAHISEGPAHVAARLRTALGVDLEAQTAWGSGWQAWAHWRRAVENLGVLVFQFPSVSLNEARGLSLLRHPLPVAAINPKEGTPEARNFTLMHEVVHLMLANGQEEQVAVRESRRGEDWLGVERFAEQAASYVLVPEEALRSAIEAERLPRHDWDIGDVRKLAKIFRMTPLAVATRLRSSGFLSWPDYLAWKAGWEAYTSGLKPKTGGFATPVAKTLGRAGRPFTKTVLDALSGNRIGPEVAARYLNLKYQDFDKLRGALVVQPGTGGTND